MSRHSLIKKELLNYFSAKEEKILGQEIMSTGGADVRNGCQSYVWDHSLSEGHTSMANYFRSMEVLSWYNTLECK